jgi:hypothetical protein
MATGVVRNPMGEVGSDVFNAETVDEKLTEFEDPGNEGLELLAQFLVSKFGNQTGVLIANHGHARRRGDHDGLGILIKADEALGLGEGLAAEAGVGVHLSATGLLGGEVQIDAQPFKQTDDGAASLGVERVVIAGDEERSAHGEHPIFEDGSSKEVWYSIQTRIVYCNLDVGAGLSAAHGPGWPA